MRPELKSSWVTFEIHPGGTDKKRMLWVPVTEWAKEHGLDPGRKVLAHIEGNWLIIKPFDRRRRGNAPPAEKARRRVTGFRASK